MSKKFTLKDLSTRTVLMNGIEYGYVDAQEELEFTVSSPGFLEDVLKEYFFTTVVVQLKSVHILFHNYVYGYKLDTELLNLNKRYKPLPIGKYKLLPLTKSMSIAEMNLFDKLKDFYYET